MLAPAAESGSCRLTAAGGDVWSYRQRMDLLPQDQADDCALRLPELFPSDFVAWFEQGRVMQAQGLLEEAASAYEGAIRLNPDFVHAMNNLGGVRKQLGKFAAAREILQLGIAKDHSFAGLEYNLGMVHAMQNDATGSVPHLEAAIKKAKHPEPPPRWHDDLAAVLHAAGRLAEALRSVDNALALEPTNACVLAS